MDRELNGYTHDNRCENKINTLVDTIRRLVGFTSFSIPKRATPAAQKQIVPMLINYLAAGRRILDGKIREFVEEKDSIWRKRLYSRSFVLVPAWGLGISIIYGLLSTYSSTQHLMGKVGEIYRR